MTGLVGPLSVTDIAEIDVSNAKICGLFALTHANARICIDFLDI